MIGKHLGSYEVIESIGKGGMGEVYRARDPKLDRDVAIKILPREMSGDPERIARFQREARTLASFQHPNIASVYGFEETGETRFLVMELVEGEDLAERLQRGPVSAEDTLEIARQIAAGLEAAHEQQIVHRDLKPANLKITPDGQVKILDFGLARAFLGDGSDDADLANSPTITAAMTQAGVVLGTAAYMSPEQARGKVVDRRADIWAFGVILFEMLTGRRLFGGETVSDTFAAVLRAEPDWDALPADLPPSLVQVMRRCLVRDPKARLRDIGEARVVLESGTASGWLPMATGELAPVADGHRRAWIGALVLVAVIAGGLAWWTKPQADPPLYQLEILPPEGYVHYDLGMHHALSPDGRSLAFVAEDSLGGRSLWVRALEHREARKLDGADGAEGPFWSPDSRNIGFFASDELRRIPVGGGPVVTLAKTPNPRGGVWSRDGRVFFSPSTEGPIAWVSAGGGEVQFASASDSLSGGSDRFPALHAGEPGVVFHSRWNVANRRIVASREGEVVPLVETPGRAQVAGNHLFYVQDGTFIAQGFDPGRLRIIGEPVAIASDVVHMRSIGTAAFSTSDAGVLTFFTMNSAIERQTRVYDRDGRQVQVLRTPMYLDDITISHDGRRVALAAAGGTTRGIDIWTYDLARAVFTRVTFDESADDPVWSPDGQWIVFAGGNDIARIRASGAGSVEMLLDDDRDKVNTDWSPDGRTILYLANEQSEDIWMLDLESDPRETSALLATKYRELHGRFSPDGKWIAYASDESGALQVYLVDFPGLTRKIQVTRESSSMPCWTKGGRELLVMNAVRELQSVPLDYSGGEWRIGEPKPMFRTGIEDYSIRTHQYDVSDDGETIVVLESSYRQRSYRRPITLVTDWKRLPGIVAR